MAAASMDWSNAPPSSSPFRPPGGSSTPEAGQQFPQQQQRMQATAPYPPPPMRPGQPVSMQRPPQPAAMYPASAPFAPQGGAYPPSYQVGSQGQLLQSYAGQTNNVPGMPQGYAPPRTAPNAKSSDWQEHIAPDGRRYYHNKRTRQSSWEKPEDLMSSTEKADASTVWKEFTTPDNKKYYFNKLTKETTWTMPDEMRLAREQAERREGSVFASTASVQSPSTLQSHAPSASPGAALLSTPQDAPPGVATAIATPSPSPIAYQESRVDEDEESKKTPSEDKPSVLDEPVLYATKMDAKNAFKELLESAHVQSDWTWDQTMRVIVTDKRYGALKTLGERKQAFNEYLAQRKKLDIEEKRTKQKKAREDFVKMLEESKELTSSMRWSKAYSMFEDDPRYLAVEKERDREDLFEDYLTDLERREREKAREEKKRNRAEFREFLESCDFIKVNTQFRKVQDRLEQDERCARLEKIDRLEVFQDYIRDLEKEEDEEKKLQKDQIRRKERKNRDEFRGLIEVHKAAGILLARTPWRDYLAKVKEHPAYQAVASNASGSTPKDLFIDAIEDLEKQYQEDKTKIKDIMKTAKVTVVAGTTYEAFKAAIAEAGDIDSISECHVKYMYDDLLERIKEKEEKEAKKRRRQAEDFGSLLRSTKSITTASVWDGVKAALEETAEYRAIGDEALLRKLFEEHLVYLQQKSKDKEKKRDKEEKSKSKDRKSKKDDDGEERKREKKHRRRHRSPSSEDGSEREEESRRSRRHKSSRRHESDSEAEAVRPRRHKRDKKEELEDGEVGEDGEIR